MRDMSPESEVLEDRGFEAHIGGAGLIVYRKEDIENAVLVFLKYTLYI